MSLDGDTKRLKVLADCCKARPSPRVLAEFPSVLEKLIADRLFLPPLFVLDILVATTRPENAITPPGFESRPSSEGWRQFMDTVARRALPGTVGGFEHGVALVWATAQSLKARSDGSTEGASIDWSTADYAKWISLGADKVLRAEADYLGRGGKGDLAWTSFWDHLNSEVATIGGRERIIPFSSSFRSRATDVFLFQELPPVDEQLDALIAEHDEYRSRGQLPVSSRIGNKDPSVRRSDAGDFFERAPGALPENVARIAPTDLVLLDAGSGVSAELKKMLKSRFAVKVVESDISQRYHSQPDPFRRSRRLEVRMSLYDDRLMSSVPPVGEAGREFSQINLYRASLVYFLHHLAQALEDSPIECDLKVSLVLGAASSMTRVLPVDFLASARRSPRDCFEALWLCFPQLFSGLVLRKLKETRIAGSLDAEASMTILLNLGRSSPAFSEDLENVCLAQVLADPATCTLCARVVGCSEEGGSAEVVRSHDAPGSVSFEVVRSIFGRGEAA